MAKKVKYAFKVLFDFIFSISFPSCFIVYTGKEYAEKLLNYNQLNILTIFSEFKILSLKQGSI